MPKPIRFNANEENSKFLRDFQAKHEKAKGYSPSLEKLANIAIELGVKLFPERFGKEITEAK